MMIRATLFFGIILLFSNCLIYRTTIESNVDNTQKVELKKVNLVVEGSIETIRFLDSLSSLIARDFQRNGIQVEKTVIHPLELKSPEDFQADYEKMLATFQPDAIFEIVEENMDVRFEEDRMGRRLTFDEQHVETIFALSLAKYGDNNKLWRAILKLNSKGNFDQLTKNDLQDTNRRIRNKLVEDGILK